MQPQLQSERTRFRGHLGVGSLVTHNRVLRRAPPEATLSCQDVDGLLRICSGCVCLLLQPGLWGSDLRAEGAAKCGQGLGSVVKAPPNAVAIGIPLGFTGQMLLSEMRRWQDSGPISLDRVEQNPTKLENAESSCWISLLAGH